MTTTRPDVIVVGAGLIGLSTAMALLEAQPGLNLTVLDKEERIAAHQSGRNSGVLHAGLYYRPGSLKATYCREGRAALIDFAQVHGIPYRLCGKLVVATDPAELERLEVLADRGRENGLDVAKASVPASSRNSSRTSAASAHCIFRRAASSTTSPSRTRTHAWCRRAAARSAWGST